MEGPWSSRFRATMMTTDPLEAPQLSLPPPPPSPFRPPLAPAPGPPGPTRWSSVRVRTLLLLASASLRASVRACECFQSAAHGPAVRACVRHPDHGLHLYAMSGISSSAKRNQADPPYAAQTSRAEPRKPERVSVTAMRSG
jgi:hypothetical protein